MYNPSKPYKDKIFSTIQTTWDSPYKEISKEVYPLVHSFAEVDHTDGIGTKGSYHWQASTFKNAVIDALAMNLNDLALVRATAYKLQNHITVPVDDKRVLKIIRALSRECRKRNIAITGGEVSIHDDYQSLDISISMSGFIKKVKPNQFQVGDTLIGIKSSGLHSNGFTKVRKLFGRSVRPEFVKPTAVYLDKILQLNEKYDIHGMMHITGGAFTKLKGLLKNADAIVHRDHKLRPQPIFREIYAKGVSDEEIYQTFNCGIGFIFSTSASEAKKIVRSNKNMDVIGEVVVGKGQVKVDSYFSKSTVVY